MKREQAQNLIRKYRIAQLTGENRRVDLERYWNSEFYPDKDSFTEGELDKIPPELIQDMLNHETPDDWGKPEFDPVLELIYQDCTRGYTNAYLLELLNDMGISCHEIEGAPESMDYCYCCFYLVFEPEASFGSICPVCFWCDAPGANSTPLEQAKKNFKEFGACDQSALEHVSKEALKMYSKYVPKSQALSISLTARDQTHNTVNMWLGFDQN